MLSFLIMLSIAIGIFAFAWIAMKDGDKKNLLPKNDKTLLEKIDSEPLVKIDTEEAENSSKPLGTIRSSYIMTYHEQAMFKLLRQALPNHYIFTQVAFSAILWSPDKDRATRNRYNRKVTDFVITCENFLIVAIIELDDASHIGKEEQDKQRDEFLKIAGYKVFRYKQLPTIEQIQQDILNNPQSLIKNK